MVDVDSAVAGINTLQAAFSVIATLLLTHDHYPADIATEDLLPTYDRIVIGGGTAGCVVASRLSEYLNDTVLLIEAGGPPALESWYAGLFPTQVNSSSDWNINSLEVDYSGQNLFDKVLALEQGLGLGGTSTINHMLHIKSCVQDFLNWVNITGDNSWSYENMLSYYKKYENVRDENFAEDSFYGTNGPLYLNTQRSSQNIPILEAINELYNGTLNNTCSDVYNRLYEPLLTLDKGVRYTAPEAYLSPNLNRTNLIVKYNTLVLKILLNSNKTAYGVEIMDSNNVTITIKAKKEVILSAGAIKSPQLLTLSGIGPKETLNDLGIDIVTELPVGQKLKDRPCAIALYTLGNTSTTTVSNYREFPAPITVGSFSLNSSGYPHYQVINLKFPKNSPGLAQICMIVFKYTKSRCQIISDNNVDNELLLTLFSIIQPYSEGEVIVNSTDPRVNPVVNLRLLSDERDSEIMGQSIMHYNSMLETPYFKNLSSQMLDLNLTNCNSLDKKSLEYYICYSKEMSMGMRYISSSCAMGKVLNPNLTVKNTNNLRVVDASAVPYPTSGNLQSTIYAMSEKAADMIVKENKV